MTSIFWDEIEEIEYLNPSDLEDEDQEYVYDFSVEDVETFTTNEGLIVHNTLNTFHYSGVSSKSNVNSGVPRIRELISVTKNQATPSLTVYLKNEHKTNKIYSKKVLNTIEKVNISYFIDETFIYYDPDVMNSNIIEHKKFFKDYYDFYNDTELSSLSPWVLKIDINNLFLLNKNMSMFDLYTFFICQYPNIHIIYTDENSKKISFYFRYLHDNINLLDDDNNLITNNDINYLKDLEIDILSKILNGIDNIEKVTMREINQIKIKQNGEIDNSKKEIVLDTTGSNFYDIIKLYDYIDINSTFSNDIHEINNILGIEAARQLLKNEIDNVMKFSGIYINNKHINLLVDYMTLKGDLLSIDRHGVRSSESGPLAKTSFEESDEHFIKSTLFNLGDPMKSLTSNLILGQTGKFGTGICDLEFNMKKFKKIINNN